MFNLEKFNENQSFPNKLYTFVLGVMRGIHVCKNVEVLTTFEKAEKFCYNIKIKVKMNS